MDTPQTTFFIPILTGLIVLVATMSFFVTASVRYFRKAQRLRVLNDQQVLAHEEAIMKTIAAELHDEIGSSIAAIKMNMQSIHPKDEQTQQLLEKTEMNVDALMARIRHISYNMMPYGLRSGLQNAIIDMIDNISSVADIEVTIDMEEINFSQDQALHLFRIIQEIFTNIIKHARASQVQLSLHQVKRCVSVQIKDNGIGFVKENVLKAPTGMGLVNISSRIEILQAKMYLTTELNKGTDYLIEIPCYDTKENQHHHRR